MAEFQLVRDAEGNVGGFWVKDGDVNATTAITLCRMNGIAVPEGGFRIEPNRANSQGGVFVLFNNKVEKPVGSLSRIIILTLAAIGIGTLLAVVAKRVF